MFVMKTGFRLVYHKDIPEHLVPLAKELLKSQLKTMIDGYKTGGKASRSFYKRGILGYCYKDTDLVFRRLSTNRRIFGIVHKDQLEGINGEIEWNQCICSLHLGGTKVKMKDGPYSEDKYITWAEIGDIKG